MSCNSAAARRMSAPAGGSAYASRSASKISTARRATCSQCRSFERHLRAKRRASSRRSGGWVRLGGATPVKSSIIERRLAQARQQAGDLGAAQLIVARARDLAAPLGLGHLGEIRERATAADHHVGREGRL